MDQEFLESASNAIFHKHYSHLADDSMDAVVEAVYSMWMKYRPDGANYVEAWTHFTYPEMCPCPSCSRMRRTLERIGRTIE